MVFCLSVIVLVYFRTALERAIDCSLCLLADNVEYGFDPHDDSDYLIIHGNDVWGNGENSSPT